MQTITHRRVVPVHSQVVVGQNVRRPVDILQRQRDGRHDALADPGPGLAGGGGEEAGDVDVVMVVTVSVGVDLQPRPRTLPSPPQQERQEETPHDQSQSLMDTCLNTHWLKGREIQTLVGDVFL